MLEVIERLGYRNGDGALNYVGKSRRRRQVCREPTRLLADLIIDKSQPRRSPERTPRVIPKSQPLSWPIVAVRHSVGGCPLGYFLWVRARSPSWLTVSIKMLTFALRHFNPE